MKVRFGIAGTGWVAGEYVKSIRSHPDSILVGGYGNNPERAKAFFSGDDGETRTYSSFEQMAEDPDIDAIVLCGMPDVRPSQAVLAAERGKHLVLEKPLALDKESLWSMAEAVEKSGVRAVSSFVLRWNPLFRTIKALIDDDALGRIFMANLDYWHHIGPQYGQYRWSSTKELGGSSVLSAGCHAVDALRYFAGDVEEVMAYSNHTWADSQYGFEPNTVAILKLASGGIAKVSSSLECKTPYKFNIHLLGEKGSVMNNQLFTHKLPGQRDYATIPTILPDSGDVTHHPFGDEIADFIAALQGGTKTKCEWSDAFRSMDVCFAIDEAAAAGRPVRLSHRY